MSLFEIEPDIRKALTLGSEFYTDPAHFELSKEKIFARTWQFLGKADEVENLKPATILPGFLDEPVLLVRWQVFGQETQNLVRVRVNHAFFAIVTLEQVADHLGDSWQFGIERVAV